MSKKTRKKFVDCLKKWNLKRNPFAEYTPGEIWAGSRDNREYLEYLLDNAQDTGGVLNYLLRGEYGSGKTFHMIALRDFVNEELNGLGLYFKFPSKMRSRGFLDILQALVDVMGPDVLIDIGKRIAGKSKIDTKDDFAEKVQEIGIAKDLGKALANIVFDEEFALTWIWLTGRATAWQTRSLGFLTTPKDEPVAIDVISGLFDFLSHKYKIISIFIDELENLKGSSKAARSVREGLRTLYDELVYEKKSRKVPVTIFLAATFSVWWELEESLESALRDRLSEEIVFSQMEKKEIAGFIKDLFSFAREDKKKSAIPPFENNKAFGKFLEVLGEERGREESRELGTTGTPRRIVKLGNRLLQRCCSSGIEKITVEHVEKYLRPAEG